MDTTASLPLRPDVDEFVNVWFDDDGSNEEFKKDFYSSWLIQSSAKHSDPSLIAFDRLRKLFPKHSLVSTQAYDLNILGFPGLSATPLSNNPLITNVVFMPFARSLNGLPGVLVDQVKVGGFEVVWKGYKFLLFMVNFPSGFGTVTQSYILHEGPEERARLLLMTIGGWSHELHDEVWVFNQGFWNKDHSLWEELQKANWDDVILKEDFKRALMKDVYGFFSAKEVYERLSIPWKRGLIMHGPPGNGKTISVKAIMKSCSENGFVPLYVKSFQSWKGEEGAMADVFAQARQVSPACLILEDLDSLINDRNRSYFLNQLDGMDSNNGLFIIGTTNHFDRLDPGLSSRPSRFDRKYLFDDPSSEERTLYVKYWQKKLSNNQEIYFPDSLIDSIVNETSGFSFAYMKEAFVSTLVTLAGVTGDKPQFGDILKEQIRDLRNQLEGDKISDRTNIINHLDRVSHAGYSEVRQKSRDVRILFDALDDKALQANPSDKIYRTLQQSEPAQPDAGTRGVRNLLGSLSDSIANMTTSRVYRPCASDGTREPHGFKDGPGAGLKGLGKTYLSSQPYGQSTTHGAYQPAPHGPPATTQGRPTSYEAALPGSSVRPMTQNFFSAQVHDASDRVNLT